MVNRDPLIVSSPTLQVQRSRFKVPGSRFKVGVDVRSADHTPPHSLIND
jgi:hypothetical protein